MSSTGGGQDGGEQAGVERPPGGCATCSSRSPPTCTSRPTSTTRSRPSASDQASSAPGCLTIAEPSGYYCSRAACMGQVPGEVVVAAFGVFNPALIIPAVERGWSIATRRRGARRPRARRNRIAGSDHRRGTSRAGRGHGGAAAGGSRRLGERPLPVRGPAFAGHPGDAVGRAVAGRRHDPRAPGRLAHRGVDRDRSRCRRDRAADRALLRHAAEALPPRPGLDRWPISTPGSPVSRDRGLVAGDAVPADGGRYRGARVDRGRHRRPATADRRRHRRRPRPRGRHARPVVGGDRGRRRLPEQRRADPRRRGATSTADEQPRRRRDEKRAMGCRRVVGR